MRLKTILVLAGALMAIPQPGLAQPADEAEQAEFDAGPTIPAVLDAEGKQAVEGINAFSLDLYLRTRKPSENLFFSPASVSTAVGFAFRGAKGATATQLKQVLHYSADPAPYLRANGAVLDTLNFTAPGRELKVANAIWTRTGMPLERDYVSDMAAFAKSGFNTVDFARYPEAARLTINRWVAGETRDRIAELLKPGIITPVTGAVLVNTIYWKGQWATQFAPAATRTEPFALLDGKKVSHPLMHQRANFQVLDRGGFKAIQLPYAGGEVAMVVLLPDEAGGLPHFEDRLTAAALAEIGAALGKAVPRETELTLPKLKLDWGSDFAETLKTMGAPLAFSDDADFSGIVKFPYPGSAPWEKGLKISKVIHQAFLEVDEKGSEATAATAVVMDVIVTGARRGPPPPPPFIFRADKPFMFLLRDLRTGAVLFMGRYVGAIE